MERLPADHGAQILAKAAGIGDRADGVVGRVSNPSGRARPRWSGLRAFVAETVGRMNNGLVARLDGELVVDLAAHGDRLLSEPNQE